jgi:DNA repair protein RecN (Recombination protein N)
MLAIKTATLLSRHDAQSGAASGAVAHSTVGAPGLIFDEVDAGIGGRVADVVGRRLHALAGAFQVLCITHLPQIAAYADTHFQIDKRVERERTSTAVRRLDPEGRVIELARMLGGASISEGLRASAREMLAERGGQRPAAESGESGGGTTGESERRKAKPKGAGDSPQGTRRTQR